ncbi:MAG: cysteine--tRNA ligase [bacterium]|nr:cysteine--tRNA ligase [bacterium]
MPLPIRLYDSLSRKLTLLEPVDTQREKVTIYTCGPTVYNYAHIGNLRSYLWEDFLTRTLRLFGYEVIHVMNITDVDDKTIRDAKAANLPLKEFTNRYTEAFFQDISALKIHPANHYPRATDFISQMQTIITYLLQNGYAYVSEEGSVYFKIDAFADYGKLSGRKNVTSHKHRIATDEYDDKEGLHDFALWKTWKEEDGDVYWDSPWGKGRPGWHIECSAMAMHYLGETIDIHCGGADNLFPHHENEIAQSEAYTGKQFVKIWLHGEWLLVDGKKMSKSLGNFFTLRDLMERGISPRTFRFFVLSTHYRSPINFTFDAIQDIENRLKKMDEFWYSLVKNSDDKGDNIEEILFFENKFIQALAEDLNTSKALAILSEFIKFVNQLRANAKLSQKLLNEIKRVWLKFDQVYQSLVPWETRQFLSEVEILSKIQERELARKNKNFDIADKIRQELYQQGVILEDTPKGTIWRWRS